MNGDVALERFVTVLTLLVMVSQLAPQVRDGARVLLERRRRLVEQRTEMDRLWLAGEEARVQVAYEQMLTEVRALTAPPDQTGAAGAG